MRSGSTRSASPRKSAEEFFTALRRAGVRQVMDIRLNNVSQLAGFAKRDDLAFFLKAICGIEYVHRPDLAPTQDLLERYRKKTIGWDGYEREFTELMQERGIRDIRGPIGARQGLSPLFRAHAGTMSSPSGGGIPSRQAWEHFPMPPLTRIICLANSRKHGAYCVAGIRPDTGEWMRPVSQLEDGRVERPMLLVGGRPPRLCDMLDIPLDPTGPDFGFEGENRSILPGPWQLIRSVSPEELIPRCSREPLILHNRETCVTVEFLKSLPFRERRTLQLVEAFEFQAFSTGLSAQGGHKWDGSFLSRAGERLRARITDPVLVEKLERGYRPGQHCLVTASLSMPFRPADWKGDGLPCWKLIAGVVELDPGAWPEDRVPSPPAGGKTPPAGKKPATDIDDERIKAALKKVFGFDSFMPHQEEVVRAILRGQDCFVVMPTGGGKSLCFQLPAHLLPGTCMVVSPLISLMKDQVDAARSNGLRAAFINSSQTDQERIGVFRDLEAGRLDLLYVSPERFAMETFLNNLKRVSLCLAAIDEAHCISEWGHDFRPDYLYLSEIVEHFPDLPVAAFTATATRTGAAGHRRAPQVAQSPHRARIL